MRTSMLMVGVLALIVSSNAHVMKRSAGDVSALFQDGKVYHYDVVTSNGVGSHDYVHFANQANFTYKMDVAAQGTELHVHATDIKVGFFNGEFDYTHAPEVNYVHRPELDVLEKPFVVKTNGKGLVEGIVVDSSIPVWAQNFQRGIATTLQMDVEHIHMGKFEFEHVEENTVVGHCKTDYTTVPHGDSALEVRKFRKHSDCTHYQRRMRVPGVETYYCPDDNSRDLLNSTGFGIYVLQEKNGMVAPVQIRSYSAVVYNVFGVDGHTQYSMGAHTLILKDITSGSVSAPSNAQSYDDIYYKFQSEMTEDEDLTVPQPYFFHQADVKLDNQDVLIQRLQENIHKLHMSLENVEVYENTMDFHKVSPFTVIPIVAGMDYDHLKQALNTFKAGDETEYKLFLDALVVSGSGPAALVIRDFAQETDNTIWLARVIAPLPNYIRNPTEKLLKEFEPLLTSTEKKHNLRVIKFAFATLLHRVCHETGCKNSGLLDKYIDMWSQEYDNASHFEEKTENIAALLNVNVEKSAMKLVSIFMNKEEEKSVRSAAFTGSSAYRKAHQHEYTQSLLSIFFDKHEDSELRNVAAFHLAVHAASESVYNQMAIAMWSEKNPQVKNYVKTLFEGLAYSTRTCIHTKASWARTAVQMLPDWEVSKKYSGSFISDYYDRQYNFGHMTHYSVQKNGHSIVPSTIHLNLNGQIAGFGTSYFTAFVRLDGVGKALASRYMTMATGVFDFDDIKDVLQKVGVQERHAEPLRIEFAIMLHNRIVAYHAADAATVTTVPKMIGKLREFAKASYDKELVRMMLLGGALVEQPNEIGMPVSAQSGVTSVAAVHAKVDSQKSGSTVSRKYNLRFQVNMHGMSSLMAHVPAFGTIHAVRAVRTMRTRVPRDAIVGVDLKQKTVSFEVMAPTEEDPFMIQTHSTAVVTVENDSAATWRDSTNKDLLHASCSDCDALETISKGKKFREERQLGSGYKYKSLEGMKIGAKYFDCEKVHSRIHVIRQLKRFFNRDTKNLHGRFGKSLTNLRLSLSYMIKSLFLMPETETCGLRAYYMKDTSAQSVFEKLEGKAKVRFAANPKNVPGIDFSLKSSVSFIYGGSTPKTRELSSSFVYKKQGVPGIDKTEISVKVAGKDSASGKTGSACMTMNEQKKKPVDYFAYEGQDEPEYVRKTSIAWSKDSEDCQAGKTGINIEKRAERSEAQKEEATLDIWPYKQCREAIQDKTHYPGDLTPAVEPCIWAAFKQTNLRNIHYTIKYKVDPEARQRWRYPGMVVGALLMPYWVPSESVHGVSHGETGVDADGKLKGEIKIDVRMDHEDPEADVHFFSSQGEEEHFHNVDLSFLPFRKPIFTRFSPLYFLAFKMGAYSYCDVTPSAVQTYDNRTYFADMSECSTLISADCSETPRYAVFGQKISADKLGLTVHMGEDKVELSDINTATINGKSITLSEKLYTPDEESNVFQIFKFDDKNVFIFSNPLSVFIRYTGHYTTVTTGSRYRGVSCGLCGNFDGCPMNDLTGPDTSCKGMEPKDMMKAYISRENQCAGVGSPCPV